MPEQVRQTRQVTDADGNVATERISTVNETVRDDVPTTVDRPSNIVARTVWLIAGIIIGLLALRFVLRGIGMDEDRQCPCQPQQQQAANKRGRNPRRH